MMISFFVQYTGKWVYKYYVDNASKAEKYVMDKNQEEETQGKRAMSITYKLGAES